MNTKQILLLCISLIAGLVLQALILSGSMSGSASSESGSSRYEFISHGDTLIIGDTQTGDYWQKYVPTYQGPTEWEYITFPGK